MRSIAAPATTKRIFRSTIAITITSHTLDGTARKFVHYDRVMRPLGQDLAARNATSKSLCDELVANQEAVTRRIIGFVVCLGRTLPGFPQERRRRRHPSAQRVRRPCTPRPWAVGSNTGRCSIPPAGCSNKLDSDRPACIQPAAVRAHPSNRTSTGAFRMRALMLAACLAALAGPAMVETYAARGVDIVYAAANLHVVPRTAPGCHG